MSRLRDHLATELAKKVRNSGLVVWDDADSAYESVAELVVPEGVALLRYEGSWFELRRALEPFLSQPSCPSVVVYVPAKPPDQDPLEEARQAGRVWSMTLRSLLRGALKGELTDLRIDALAKQTKTIAEAEAVLDCGSAVDARLVSTFRTTDLVAIACEVLAADLKPVVESGEVRHLVAESLSSFFGMTVDERDATLLRASVFRGVVIGALSEAAVDIPEAWRSTFGGSVKSTHATRCADVLRRLREPRFADMQRALGDAADRDLAVRERLVWSAQLAACDATPAIEEVAFDAALRLLAANEPADAAAIAATRLRTSRWAQPATHNGAPIGPEHPNRRWNALLRIADLKRLCADTRPANDATSDEVLKWYSSEGWRVDRAHRLAELARIGLGHLAGLDEHVSASRADYERWLDAVCTVSTNACVKSGLSQLKAMRQGDIFETIVSKRTDKMAYVLVDALRFELGQSLCERLGAGGDRAQSTITDAVACAPTITPVGMSAVLPGAATGLSLAISGGALVVTLDGAVMKTVPDRIGTLRQAVGDVLEIDFTNLVARSDAQLKEEIQAVDLVVVRSTDIDAAGESGRIGSAWRTVDDFLDDLTSQLFRLGRLGIERAVVVADHGFIVLSQQLSSGRVLERPSNDGELHRRCWIGKGGVTPDGAVRFTAEALGVGGDVDVVVPKGLAVFPSSGSRQFFHGGLSPQELVIPVIEVALQQTTLASSGHPKVTVAVAGRGITTGVFAATLSFSGDLFASEVAVRVTARTGKDAKPCARLVAGDGYNAEGGTVTVSSEPSVLTFQVVADLDKSTPVFLHVEDARTGMELVPPKKVAVVSNVKVEDEWL